MDEQFVLARGVLLDALEALGPHRKAVTLVGAHATNVWVGEADLPVAPYTTDGDLAIEPPSPSKAPLLEQMLTEADFLSKDGDTSRVVSQFEIPQYFS